MPTAAAAHTVALARLTGSRDTEQTAKPSLTGTANWGSQILEAAEEALGTYVEQVLPS